MKLNRINSLSLAAGFLIIGLFVAFGCSSTSSEGDGEILVFAAASTTNSLNEIIETYEKNSGTRVRVSYGGSQSLAQQIVSGAPADLIVSAGVFPITNLINEGFVESESVDLFSNRLVVVVHADVEGVGTLDALASQEVERLAIADPALAPAGRYAQESLMSAGMWEGVKDKLVIGSDVRATLAYVESGNADAAIVYETDARVSDSLKVLDIVPQETYSQVLYPAAIISTSDSKPEAESFLDFLLSDLAKEIFRKYGFTPLTTTTSP